MLPWKMNAVHHHVVQRTQRLEVASRCTVLLMAYPAKTDRSIILAAALEQVETDGVENLAVRAIAAKLGLAPNALYRYFENLAALKAALAEEVRRQMLEGMKQAVGRKGAAEAIRAISEAYLRFALERPRVFALYLKTSGAEEQTPQCAENTEFFFQHVARVYGGKQPEKAAHALWAFLHGSAVLLDAGLVPAEQAFANLRFGLQIWIESALRSSR